MPITPGFRFKEGKLHIFAPEGVMLLHAWPKLEAVRKANCVASYVAAVLEGHTYIYRVLAPERATLSLTRDSVGNWNIDQLEARNHRAVRPETLETVAAWLEGYSPFGH